MKRLLILLFIVTVSAIYYPLSANAQDGYLRRPRQTCMQPSEFAPPSVWAAHRDCLRRGGNVDFYDPYDDYRYRNYDNYPYYGNDSYYPDDDYYRRGRRNQPIGRIERLITYGSGGALIGGGLGGKRGAFIGAGAGVVIAALENRAEDKRAKREAERAAIYQQQNQQYPDRDQRIQESECLIINLSGYNIEVTLGGAKLALPNGSTFLQNNHSSSSNIPMAYWGKLTALVHAPAGIVQVAFERSGNTLTLKKLKL